MAADICVSSNEQRLKALKDAALQSVCKKQVRLKQLPFS